MVWVGEINLSFSLDKAEGMCRDFELEIMQDWEDLVAGLAAKAF